MPSKNNKKDNFVVKVFKSQVFFSLLALALLVIILIPIYKNWQERKVIDREIALIQEDIEKYEKSNEELKAMLSYLESQDALEAQARLNLGLKKPEEEVVVIKIEGEESGPITNIRNDIKEELSNPQRWFRYFFK